VRIKVINPVISKDIFPDVVQSFATISNAEKVDVEFISHGPSSIESEVDVAMAQPGLLDSALRAERDGYDGLIINCMCDPGLQACRELLQIPVTAPAESSAHYASILAERFSIITTLNEAVSQFRRLCGYYGFTERLASVRAVEIPVLELEDNWSLVLERFMQGIKLACEEDGAQAVIPGCTGFSTLIEAMERQVREDNVKVVIIDPVKAAVFLLESLIRFGVQPVRTAPNKQVHLPGDFAEIKRWSEIN